MPAMPHDPSIYPEHHDAQFGNPCCKVSSIIPLLQLGYQVWEGVAQGHQASSFLKCSSNMEVPLTATILHQLPYSQLIISDKCVRDFWLFLIIFSWNMFHFKWATHSQELQLLWTFGIETAKLMVSQACLDAWYRSQLLLLQLAEEEHKITSKEQFLQLKMLDLEYELRQKKEEHQRLARKLNTVSRHFFSPVFWDFSDWNAACKFHISAFHCTLVRLKYTTHPSSSM